MGTYDEYGYLGIQIKMNETGEMKRFKIGDLTPLSSGLYFGFEGVVVINGFGLIAVYPYEKMWDKWGVEIGPEVKAIIGGNNPVKIAVDSLGVRPMAYAPSQSDVKEFIDLIDKTKKEVEAEMEEAKAKKPYWMVHRRGTQSGPATHVHHEFDSAMTEAIRLARLEMDSFDVMESVFTVKPQRPVDVDVEPFDVFGDYFENLLLKSTPSEGWWSKGLGEADPDEPECCGGTKDDCCQDEPECTCDPDSDEVGILCMAPDGKHICRDPEPECTCAPGTEEGCNICGGEPDWTLDLPPDLVGQDVVDALAYSMAMHFGIPIDVMDPRGEYEGLLDGVECCDADGGHEPTEHPFAHGLEDECEICAGIELDLAEFEAEERCEICDGISLEEHLEEHSKPENEECEICAIMEKLDMPAIYHPPLGRARCAMEEIDLEEAREEMPPFIRCALGMESDPDEPEGEQEHKTGVWTPEEYENAVRVWGDVIEAGLEAIGEPETEPQTEMDKVLAMAEEAGMPQDELDAFVETAVDLQGAENEFLMSVAEAINVVVGNEPCSCSAMEEADCICEPPEVQSGGLLTKSFQHLGRDTVVETPSHKLIVTEGKGCCDENEKTVNIVAGRIWKGYIIGCSCSLCTETREDARQALKDCCGH